MECTKRVACSRPLSRSTFSIKNILNLQDGSNVVDFPRLPAKYFDDETSSIPQSIVAPVPYNPSPLMNSCTSFGLPLYAPIIWTSIGTGIETPASTCNRNVMMHQFSSAFEPYTNLHPRRGRKLSTKKKKRPLFSQQQVQTMEKEFTKHRYITESKRAELSIEVDLTETQIKTWFQNRRTKWRKELRDKVATTVD